MTRRPSAEIVAIIAPDLWHGGSVGVVALRHAVELSRTFRVVVISRAVPPDTSNDFNAVIVRPASWNWLRRFCHVPNELSFLWAARRALRGLCRRETIDVVWCHSHGATALAAAPLRKRFRFRVVMTTHGDIFDRPSGSYSPELTWFYRKVTPIAYRQADRVQALSPYMAECAIRGGAAADRVAVVPNGVDAAEIGAEDIAARFPASFIPEGRLRLLYVGSLWKVKGIDVLLRAVAMLKDADRKSAPSRGAEISGGVTLTLIGEGTLRDDLKRLTEALGITDKVLFAGRVPRRELAGRYAQADILCVPSLSESLPTVVMEAMLCGLPVVGSDTGGIPSLVEPGVTGYLATPGDAGSLADSITKAAASREHLAQLGAQGFLRAHQRFGWNHVAQQLVELARDTLRLP